MREVRYQNSCLLLYPNTCLSHAYPISLFCIAMSLFVPGMNIMKGQKISSPKCGGYFIRIALVALFGFLSGNCVQALPATFSEAFQVTWGADHLRQMEGGNAIQLKLDQSSGIT